MKKYTLALLVLLTAPLVSFAQSDAQAEISRLLQLIQQLQAQVAQLQTGGSASQVWCHTFSTNLRIGDTNNTNGSDVFALNRALEKEGLLSTAEDSISYTRFSEETASAVVAFQEKYSGEILAPHRLKRGTGYVGASTRVKLNRLYGCGNSNPSYSGRDSFVPPVIVDPGRISVTVLSPNKGEVWPAGSVQSVTWSTNGIARDSLGTVRLRGESDRLEYPLYAAGNKEVPLYQTPNDGNEQVFVPTDLPDQKYRVEVKMSWGSESYTDVSDLSIAVRKPESARPYVYVVSPNGDETWVMGSFEEIKWKAPESVRDVVIMIADADRMEINDQGTKYLMFNELTSHGVGTPNDGVYGWTVGKSENGGNLMQDGHRYVIRVQDKNARNTGAYGDSKGSFKFVVFAEGTTLPSPSPQASILVVSPKAGDTWQVDSTQRIYWETANIESSNSKITIYITPADDMSKNINIAGGLPNTGYYDYTIPDPNKFSYRSPLFQAGNIFRLMVCAAKEGSTDLCAQATGWSDGPFMIAAKPQ